MGHEAQSSKLVHRTIRDAGRALEDFFASSRSEEIPDPSRWWIFMDIIQLAFEIGELVLDCTWNTVILILKGGGEY